MSIGAVKRNFDSDCALVRRATYMVVVSRPYELSFYAKANRVAWVAIAAYRSSCGKDNSVTRIK
jgi:hypothetical protein